MFLFWKGWSSISSFQVLYLFFPNNFILHNKYIGNKIKTDSREQDLNINTILKDIILNYNVKIILKGRYNLIWSQYFSVSIANVHDYCFRVSATNFLISVAHHWKKWPNQSFKRCFYTGKQSCLRETDWHVCSSTILEATSPPQEINGTNVCHFIDFFFSV